MLFRSAGGIALQLLREKGIEIHGHLKQVGTIQDTPIETVQRLQNVQVANLEEIAYRMGYITKEQVLELAQPLKKNEYGQYLLRLIGEA